MPDHIQIVGATLGALAAYELLVGRKLRKRIRHIACCNVMQAQTVHSLNEQIAYLCHVLNENKVELDEFDLMVLTNIERQQ